MVLLMTLMTQVETEQEQSMVIGLQINYYIYKNK
jgi:hypothetical protein